MADIKKKTAQEQTKNRGSLLNSQEELGLGEGPLCQQQNMKSPAAQSSEFSSNKNFITSIPNLRELLKEEKNIHTRSFPCSFEGCAKKFNLISNLKVHMRIHRDEKPYACLLGCGKSFRTNGNMQDHVRRHKNER